MHRILLPGGRQYENRITVLDDRQDIRSPESPGGGSGARVFRGLARASGRRQDSRLPATVCRQARDGGVSETTAIFSAAATPCSGIGRAAALRLAAEGAEVIVGARRT